MSFKPPFRARRPKPRTRARTFSSPAPSQRTGSLPLRLVPPAPAAARSLRTRTPTMPLAGHGEIWATPETLAIYRRRHPTGRAGARAFRTASSSRARAAPLRLLPAGHVLGSAQVWLGTGEDSLLYTGDFKRGSLRTAAPAAAPAARDPPDRDDLRTARLRFPDRRARARLLAACREAFDGRQDPVLLAYAFGKAQEAAALTEAGIPTVLHGAAWKLLPEFEAAGIAFPLSRAYETGPAAPGRGPRRSARPARGRPSSATSRGGAIVYLSGWAMREASRADFDADVLLPMSDHADFDALRSTLRRRARAGRDAPRLRAGLRAHPCGARDPTARALGGREERPAREDDA